MQKFKALLFVLSLLPLQSFAENQITSEKQHIQQLKHDFEIWKMRDNASCKIRNMSGIITLACAALYTLGGFGADYAMDKRNKPLFISSLALIRGSQLVGLLSAPPFSISFTLSLFSKCTVHELKQKLESLGFHVDQEDLVEIQDSVTKDFRAEI